MLRKFTSLTTLLFFLVSVVPIHAAGWIEKEKGTIQNVQGITKSGENYFGVGNGSNIIRSTDNGKTWAVSDQSGNVYWQDVDSIGQTIRVVGEGGAMRVSTDGGVSWNQQSLEISDTLYDIDTSATYGYIVGASGRILYSATNNWIRATSPTTVALYGVQDRGDGTAWIVGSGGILLQTADAGKSWFNKGKIADTDLYAVWFSSSSVGYAVGKSGTIRKTTDGGSSWASVTVSGLATQTLTDIEMVGEEIVISGDKIIIRSQDSGVTWTATDYTTQNYRFNDVYILSALEVWVVGTKDDVQSVMLKYEEDPVIPVEVLVEPPSSTDPSVVGESTPNTLIKLACVGQTTPSDPCRAVYFYSSDGKRHAFPNDKVFFSWFDNFDSVKEISSTFLSSLALGKNVTYHPGTKMVKFQSSPTVYAVSKKGVLRSVGSEQIAIGLYGTDWNKKIDDISDAFFGNYSFGTKIEKMSDYDVAAEKTSVSGLDENY